MNKSAPKTGKEKTAINDSRLQNIWIVTLLANICCALWGSAIPCIKTGYAWLDISRTSDQIVFAGLRFTLAGIQLFALYPLLYHRVCRLKKGMYSKAFGLGMAQTFLQYFFFYIGMANVTGVKGSIITAANSFFVIVLAHFFIRGEQLNLKKAVGCLLGLAGVIAVNWGGDFSGGMSLTGEGFLLIAGFSYGVAQLLSKKLVRDENPVAIICYNFLFGGVSLLAVGFLMGGTIPHFTAGSLLLLFYMGVISAGAFTIWTLLLKYNQVSRISMFNFMTPVYGCLFSALILGESFWRPEVLAALALVCAGILVVNHKAPRS
ncbi:MAG: DMT family transporter [Lachnospiraceae bacterium]|nr:DMT family transporter [Lachnospiraceae bacterium]